MISLLISPINAVEIKDCSQLKKFSKSFFACKSGNLKAGIVNTGSKIKKNTVGKIKKSNKDKPKMSTTAKEKTTAVKESVSKVFKGNKKKYPKFAKPKQ